MRTGEISYDDSDSDSGSEEEDYPDFVQSIRTETGLETGVEIAWPGLTNPPKLQLSTCLEPTDIAPMFGGTQWAGTRIWRAAIAATEYVLDQFGDKAGSSMNFLELGAGLGVPGMILHALLEWNVVLTDKEPLHRQLEVNCRKNFPDSYGKSIEAEELDWSRKGVHELLEKGIFGQTNFSSEGFDIVLNCDCVYEPLYGLSWKYLVEVTDELLRINPRTIMITSLERRKADGVDDFLDALRQSPQISEVVPLYYMDSKYPEVQLYRIHGTVTT